MNRIVFWLLSTVTVVVLLFGYHTSTSSSMPLTASAVSPSGGFTGTTDSSGTAEGTTVTGSVAQTRWGPVQVQLTVDSGKITKVAVLQYPSNNSRDREINARALPVLVQSTLSAQNAGIDMVSGATVTSQGYLQSLQSALDQAGL
jgi:uncharacterized protein with FMN-binding domain